MKCRAFLNCFLLSFLYLQCECSGGSLDHGRRSPPVDVPHTMTSSVPLSCCQCVEYLSRIADLEGRLSLMKRQASTAMTQASKSYGLMK
jgi:hypothetical protein